MQDRIYRIVEIFLHRTAGYIWVICGSRVPPYFPIYLHML